MIKRVFLVLLTLSLVSMSFASAELFVSQPQSTYALGDSVSLDITINSASQSVNFLSVKLVCPNGEVEIYKSQLSVQANQEKTTHIDAVLSRNFVGELKGSCTFNANFGSESSSTQAFTLSDSLTVQYYLSKSSYSPGESVNFEGLITRVTGTEPVGFVEVAVTGLPITLKKQFTNGKFSANFTIPKNAPAGNYALTVYAYEKDSSDEITNSGTKEAQLIVPQILSSIELSLSGEQIVPGNPLSYTIKALDQSGTEMSASLDVSIYSPNDKLFSNEKATSGQAKTLETKKNFQAGYWRVEASYSSISGKKLFYVSELEEADFELINNTLIVTNVGNIPYAKDISVKIGNQTVLINANKSIAVGQSKKFDVSAPDGEYEISILGDGGLFNLGRAFLTGRAISIDEIGSGIKLPKLALWLILVLFAGLIVGYIYIRGKRTHSPLEGVEIKNPFKLKKSQETRKAQMPVLLSSNAITNGQKETASFLVLKSSQDSEALTKALSSAESSGAHIYKDGSYNVMVFSPSKTKKLENELLAAKTATMIKESIDNHNIKFKEKIDYGMALSSGQIISDTSSGKYNFVLKDAALSSGKKLSSTAKSEILVNETIRAKLLSGAKTQKHGEGVWKLISVSDKEKYKDFLKGFTKRQD